MKNIPLLLLAIAAAFLTACNRSGPSSDAGDVAFAQTTFESLARGDSSVAANVDWATFTALGQNVGASYVTLTSDVERERFTNGFITQFASSFRDSGGSVGNFTNWRVTFKDEQRTDVAADSANGLLKLTVSERDSIERISALDIIK